MIVELTPNFSSDFINKMIAEKLQKIEDKLLEKFDQIGIQFVNDARNNGEYTDRTGNLRSSVGYIIFKDGEPYAENFEESNAGTDKETGMSEGKRKAMQSDKIPKQGFALVVIAGMNYALYVEAKGYDVISGSSMKAEKGLRNAIKNLIV